MKKHWKALSLILTLSLMGVGTLVYAGVEGNHEEGSKTCKAKHACGECQKHESGGHGDSE